MLDKNVYNSLKEKYGRVASWAVWERPYGSVKSNMSDISMFDTDAVLEELNPNFVFVGLNGSGVHDEYMDMDGDWFNFHSSNPHGHDYKLRYALMNTPYWGAYITDAIKEFPEVDSNKVATYLKKYPEIIDKNMAELRSEIMMLGSKPIIVAMGEKSYDLVNKYLGSDFTVKKIMHYSYAIGKEDYRKHVLDVLSDCGSNSKTMIPLVTKADKKMNEMQSNKSEEKITNRISEKKTVSLDEQLHITGLDIPNNWKGDIRNQLIQLFAPLINGSDYRIVKNERDSSKPVLDLIYKDSTRRSMGFNIMKDMMFKIYPVQEFYEVIKDNVTLPEPDPKKSTPHITVTVKQMWDLIQFISR